MGEIQTGRIQGGTHEETPRPEVSVMDGTACLTTEVRMGLGVVQAKVVAAKEVELVDGETERPRDVGPMEGGRFDFLWGFSGFLSARMRHGTVFKRRRWWTCL